MVETLGQEALVVETLDPEALDLEEVPDPGEVLGLAAALRNRAGACNPEVDDCWAQAERRAFEEPLVPA